MSGKKVGVGVNRVEVRGPSRFSGFAVLESFRLEWEYEIENDLDF